MSIDPDEGTGIKWRQREARDGVGSQVPHTASHARQAVAPLLATERTAGRDERHEQAWNYRGYCR